MKTDQDRVTATQVIAIVEDDAAVRQALGNLLRSDNRVVELYASGNDLLQSGSLDAVCCLVTDVKMPAMDGFTLCEALRARGIFVPVVLMTAFPEPDHQARAAAIGAACLLSKPFMDTDFIHCIERALAPSGANAVRQTR